MTERQLAVLAPDLAGSFRALRRAAAAARQLSLDTGTPFYVFKDGHVVDLNAGRSRKATSRARRRRAR